MNSVFGGYTGAGIMYGGVDSEYSSDGGNPPNGYESSVGEPSMTLYSSDGESPLPYGGGNGTASDDENSTIYKGNMNGVSDNESINSDVSAMSLNTAAFEGGAASNPREYNQSWFIEKHKIKNKSKSKDYSRFEELVDIIYEALNDKI
jgi:hypothetical protein